MRKTPNVRLYEFREDSLYPVAMEAFFFPGGEPHINQIESLNPDGHYVIRLYGGSFEDLGLALVIKDYLVRHPDGPARRIDLFAPYFPGARQDRGAPLTVKVYANVIYDAYFNNVYVVDPHSDAVWDSVDALTIIRALDIVPEGLFSFQGVVGKPSPTFSVIAPDAGATRRAQEVADRFNVPLVTARKKRDADNNFRVGEYECDPVTTDYAVVIDDICDGGGTFLALAEVLNMPAERLRLWTTHATYSKGTEALYQKYGMLATTDSINHTGSIHWNVPLVDVLADVLRKEIK